MLFAFNAQMTLLVSLGT